MPFMMGSTITLRKKPIGSEKKSLTPLQKPSHSHLPRSAARLRIPAPMPCTAAIIVWSKEPATPHQSMFLIKVAMPVPICPQSTPLNAVSNVSRIPSAASLRVMPKSAQFMLLKKAFILLAIVSPSLYQSMFLTKVCTELIAPLRPLPRAA